MTGIIRGCITRMALKASRLSLCQNQFIYRQ